ncbi:MAG: hypothetical protein R6W86_13670 [Marinobacter sp.]|uniref:hypothetical protein n=1 Tax=Marinobacter sp. TaxID=50741 RepID=UPI00396E3B26
MSIYNWLFEKLTGVKPADPELNARIPENDAEKYLETVESWPHRITGEFFLLDSGSEQGKYAHWAIGTFELAGFNEPILVEFKGPVLENAGVTTEFDLPRNIALWVSAPEQEYYQVAKLEII